MNVIKLVKKVLLQWVISRIPAQGTKALLKNCEGTHISIVSKSSTSLFLRAFAI